MGHATCSSFLCFFSWQSRVKIWNKWVNPTRIPGQYFMVYSCNICSGEQCAKSRPIFAGLLKYGNKRDEETQKRTIIETAAMHIIIDTKTVRRLYWSENHKTIDVKLEPTVDYISQTLHYTVQNVSCSTGRLYEARTTHRPLNHSGCLCTYS